MSLLEGIGPVSELANSVLPLTNDFYDGIARVNPDMPGHISEFIREARHTLISDPEFAEGGSISTMGLRVERQPFSEDGAYTIEVYAHLGTV